jgi:uncharacterized protein
VSAAPGPVALASAVYEGHVRHVRHRPVRHAFSYRIAQLYLDLEELDQVFRGRWLWSVGRRNLAEFRRQDYLGPAHLPLAAAVRARVERSGVPCPQGPIRLLTHLRYGGYIFNPVSFYYCFARDGVTLETVVAEITNTPWGERHAYVLPVAQAQRQAACWRWSFDKSFHVSPFMPMNCHYAWSFDAPHEELHVHMAVRHAAARTFDAALSLKRRPLSDAALRAVLVRYPLMTFQVIGAIHWQALRLWLKRSPVHSHPLRHPVHHD